jgi:hypothetical protein
MLEGIPSIVLGGIMFVLLPNNIATASMLTPEEREVLAAEVARDHLPGVLEVDFRTMMSMLRAALCNKYMWPIFVAGLLMSIATATFVLYTPIILKNLISGTAFGSAATVQAAKGSKDLRPIALSIAPFTIALVLSYVVAHSSQRHNEQLLHNFCCLLFAGIAMALFTPLAMASVVAGFIALTLSLAVSFAAIGPGMVLVARLCRGREQPIAQPLSNTFNLFGGIIGPFIVGALMKTQVGCGLGRRLGLRPRVPCQHCAIPLTMRPEGKAWRGKSHQSVGGVWEGCWRLWVSAKGPRSMWRVHRRLGMAAKAWACVSAVQPTPDACYVTRTVIPGRLHLGGSHHGHPHVCGVSTAAGSEVLDRSRRWPPRCWGRSQP